VVAVPVVIAILYFTLRGRIATQSRTDPAPQPITTPANPPR